MAIEAINAVTPLTVESISVEKPSLNFIDFVQNEVIATNDNIASAEQSVQKLAMGEAENLHQVMMSLEKAKTSFEMVVQVRNKLLEGYQEIMRMQV